jgi:aryl-alcohol dehydrogenase-like predicted oxidoreductase
LKYISFGKTDLKPSKIGYGCSQIASLSTRHPQAEVRATLLEAFDHGINFFDTANIYGQGDSERLLGRLFRNKRDKIVLCTKAGITIRLSQNLTSWVKPFLNPILRRWKDARAKVITTRRQTEGKFFDPNYLRNQIRSSLRRLKTDYLDLFLLHSPPVAIGADRNVFEMLEELKRQGMIRYYGISCGSAADAMTFLDLDGIACLQVPANIMQSEVLHIILPAAQKKGLAVISREPFGGGAIFSYEPLTDFCDTHLHYKKDQVALQYLLNRDDTGVILVGMTCRQNLHENLISFAGPPLGREKIQTLEKLVHKYGPELA